MPNENNGKKVLIITLVSVIFILVINLITNLNILDFGYLVINIVYLIKVLLIKVDCWQLYSKEGIIFL